MRAVRVHMRGRLEGAAAGFVAGLVATAAMSVVMLVAKRVGLTGELPPERISREAIEEAGDPPSEESEDVVATLLHFAFGSGAGAVLGALLGRDLSVMVRIPFGLAYATGVWVVSYLGWIPALGLLPPATRDRPGRVWVMLVAHWVYGTVAVAAHSVIESRRRSLDG